MVYCGMEDFGARFPGAHGDSRPGVSDGRLRLADPATFDKGRIPARDR